MPEAPRAKYDLAEIIKNELAKNQPLELSCGDVVAVIQPPILWPRTVTHDEDGNLQDNETSARVLLGDAYDAYIASGGTSQLLFERIIPDWQGATMGESSASTGS